MPAKYVIKPNDAGRYDVLYAQLFSFQESEAVLRNLLANGWSQEDARSEVSRIPKAFERCNKDPGGYTMEACSEFIASYIQPGDLILVEDQGIGYVVQKRGRA